MNQYKFKACLIASDGDSVTDFSGKNTPDEVNELLCDMGSRWHFYPFAFVISETTKKVKITNTAFPECVGWHIDKVKEHIKNNQDFAEWYLSQ